jgi:hypothetical protein
MVLSWAGGSGPLLVVMVAGAVGSGGWGEGDGVAEGFELCDQAAGFPFGVQPAGEVVLAELVVGFAGGQDAPVALCPPCG